MPTHELEDGGWLHPSRLPLGGGWSGHCTAPGHEGVEPAAEELRDSCNMGYAAKCPHLPVMRSYDAIRFAVLRHQASQVSLTFVCERDHLPGEHGTLEYNAANAVWITTHSDPRIAKMADCYLQAHLRNKPAAELRSASAEQPFNSVASRT